MSESESIPDVQAFAPRTYLATMPRWKIGMVLGAAVMIIFATITMMFESPAPAGIEGPKGTGALPAMLVPGQNPAADSEGGAAETMPWSEALFRFGFSFFIGFTIGYASRAFFKFLMFLVGGLAIFLFLMSYYGFVSVEWLALDEAFSTFGTALKGQFGAFRTFITGSLPNAGLAGLGLFTGFKKNA